MRYPRRYGNWLVTSVGLASVVAAPALPAHRQALASPGGHAVRKGGRPRSGRQVESCVRLVWLGLVDLAEDKPQAREHILGSMPLASGELRVEASCLIGVAGLATKDGASVFAAQLLRAVQSALDPQRLVVEPMVHFFHAQTLAKVKAALDETTFEASWKEGSLWSFTEAIRRALAGKPDKPAGVGRRREWPLLGDNSNVGSWPIV